MAAVLFQRGVCRSCTINSSYGVLRMNGIHKVPPRFVLPATKLASHVLIPYKAKFISISAKKSAAPEIEQAGHDHVLHWTAERILSGILMGAIPLAVAFPSPAVEYFLALSMTLHSHWGIEAIVVDYVRPSVFGKVIPKLAVGAVYGLSFLTLGGLCYFIYTDVGIINAVKLLWKL
ncbi:succinate dehydrogenase [ubiquinone] cytochrome b small subunit, mitochondrial isoform X1 [Macrobrachium rosenbergii]|uniref:succinate dehydrogenase [ubiquinone] cytochrome b small subunit, mitochondrial isoform X1 n=1 Tax=Macrobrachium rosenbergii TaxID=79674 RepID=UPI0034D4D146